MAKIIRDCSLGLGMAAGAVARQFGPTAKPVAEATGDKEGQ